MIFFILSGTLAKHMTNVKVIVSVDVKVNVKVAPSVYFIGMPDAIVVQTSPKYNSCIFSG